MWSVWQVGGRSWRGLFFCGRGSRNVMFMVERWGWGWGGVLVGVLPAPFLGVGERHEGGDGRHQLRSARPRASSTSPSAPWTRTPPRLIVDVVGAPAEARPVLAGGACSRPLRMSSSLRGAGRDRHPRPGSGAEVERERREHADLVRPRTSHRFSGRERERVRLDTETTQLCRGRRDEDQPSRFDGDFSLTHDRSV